MPAQESPFSLRSLDHLVLPVSSLGAARDRLTKLGFCVAADAVHPFGTENACVFLADGIYLEPLGIASRETCEAAAIKGNVFVARDQAYRFRKGQDGFSALVLSSRDAAADHARYRREGMSGGEMLEFSRPFQLADGTSAEASFRLAFAADLRSPDFFLFACERTRERPALPDTLLNHANVASGLTRVVLSEENPTDFQYLFETAFGQRDVTAHSFGMDLKAANVTISVLTPAGLEAWYGVKPTPGRGLVAQALVFAVPSLATVEAQLVAHNITFETRHQRILVGPAPGQGAVFAFEERA